MQAGLGRPGVDRRVGNTLVEGGSLGVDSWAEILVEGIPVAESLAGNQGSLVAGSLVEDNLAVENLEADSRVVDNLVVDNLAADTQVDTHKRGA